MGEKAQMGDDRADTRMTRKLIDGLYVEAMLLVDEARSYFDDGGRADRDRLDPMTRVSFSCESLRVTTRLMHVVAWLLTRRAIDAGEIGEAQGREPQRRLGDAADSDPVTVAAMPGPAQGLIRASTELYGRVRRLDRGLDSDTPAASPARSLFRRLEGAF